MAKFTIGRFEFATKEAAFDEIKKIKNEKYKLHEPIQGDDLELILALLEQHDDAGRRFLNVKHIAAQEDIQPGRRRQRALYVDSFDGIRDVFSISPKWYKGMTEEARLRSSIGGCCGIHIRHITLAHKQAAFPNGAASTAQCEATGATLGWHDADVDHSGDWPMVRIVQEWLDGKEPLSWNYLTKQTGEAAGWRLTDVMATDFVRFHDARAILKVVHLSHNRSKGSGGYRRQ